MPDVRNASEANIYERGDEVRVEPRPAIRKCISGKKFYSIYRRSLVINLQAKITPETEYRSLPKCEDAASGEFAMGDSLKSFLSNPPAWAPFLEILFAYEKKQRLAMRIKHRYLRSH